MGSSNASREEFLVAREATGPAKVTLWQMLRGGIQEDPLVRWTRIREQHGDVARYQYGPMDSYLVSHPDGARRVLQDNVGNYTKRHTAYGMIRRLVGNGLLTSEGDFWLRQRRLAQPAFHKQRLAAMGERMTAAALQTAEGWEARAGSGETFSMLHEMSALTLRIVGDALFGTGLDARVAEVSCAWDTLNGQFVDRYNKRRLLPAILPTAYDREYRTAQRTMRRVVETIIRQKRAEGGGEGEDLLSMLMAARDEDTGEGMTDAQLRDEVMTMVLAGHETTAITLSWCWALLDRHPDVARRLNEELAQVLGGRAPSVADLSKLAFTRAVIDEALRLYPPAYIWFRKVMADDVVCGVRVHEGGVVILAPMVFHRHPRYWERPDDFWPERWLDAEAEKKRPRFAYLPFSGGPRQCIGNNFALMEATLVLATLAQRFRARLAPGYRLLPEYLVTLRPALGLPMRLERADREAPRAA